MEVKNVQVTNVIEILQNVWCDDKKNKVPVHMKGAKSGCIIVSITEG